MQFQPPIFRHFRNFEIMKSKFSNVFTVNLQNADKT